MRAILSLLLIVSAVQAAELRVNRGILPGGLVCQQFGGAGVKLSPGQLLRGFQACLNQQ